MKTICFDKYDLKDFVREIKTPLDKRTNAAKHLQNRAKQSVNFRYSDYGIFSGLTISDFYTFSSFQDN